ncbi:MAG: CoA-binding protein [Nitrospinae bacterium]|nr:CoA-binding protein [Nitrospinota bacterium]
MADSCDIGNRPSDPDFNPSDDEIASLLKSSATIAIVGLSDKPHRDSFIVAQYLTNHGYEIVPVNPALAERGWLDIKAYPDIASIPGDVDVIDLFRRADSIMELVPAMISKKPKAVWLQLGIVNNEAASLLRYAGITVIQNKCVKIEHSLLIGG